MPKGVQNSNPEIIERLKVKVVHSLAFSLNTNKNYDLLSNIIFERTGALLSNSTLRRVFQYDSDNSPTKGTLDLICMSIGFANWEDFIENDVNRSQSNLSQSISFIKQNGINDHEQTLQIIANCSQDPYFYILLDTIVQIAITSRNIRFLSQLFDLPGVFGKGNEMDSEKLKIFYLVHNLVIGLNQSGLMPELIEYYGSHPKAQVYMVEWYVDEDNLNGYYYQLLQVYHKHKKTPEAILFYNCLMYQHAIENNLPTGKWVDLIQHFDETIHIHHLPRARRLATLLLEAKENEEIIAEILNKTYGFFKLLNEDEKINDALYMVKLLFAYRRHKMISAILSLAPDSNEIDTGIDNRLNINQLKIYRAYSLFTNGEKANALLKLNEFNPVFVNNFIHNHIIHDHQVISEMIMNE